MRDYSKAEPKMWHGNTIKALRKSQEGLIVALYLMTSPQSNMLGLFMQPVMYMAYETGLGLEGATKGLTKCIEVGFCAYDEDSEFVWVYEMAKYQIAPYLKATDLRVKGVQREYDNLPENPFLAPFFDRYNAAFLITGKRELTTKIKGVSQAPYKPLPSQEQEQEQEHEQDTSGRAGKPAEELSKTELWKSAVSLLSGQGVPETQARSLMGKLVQDYKSAGEDIVLTAVRGAVTEQPADARAYLKATCQRLAGERKRDGTKDWTANAT